MKTVITCLLTLVPPLLQGLLAADEPAAAPAAAPTAAPGYLGVMLAPVPEALRAHLKVDEGAMVQEVLPGSPADKGGLRLYDVIVSVNGQAARSPEELKKLIRSSRPGEAMKLEVKRGSETATVEVTLGAAPPPLSLEKEKQREEKREESQSGFLGVVYNKVSPDLAAHLGLKEGLGVVVGDVWKGSPAEKAGIAEKDVIVAIDGKEVQGPSDFLHLLSEKKAGDEVTLEVIHKGEKKTVKAVLSTRPRDLPDAGYFPRPGDRSDRFFWQPRSARRGKIILRSPDGEEHTIQLPEAIWKTEDLFRDLEDRFGDFQRFHIPQLKERLRHGLRELEDKLKDGDDESRWSASDSENHVSTVRQVEGGYDITLRDVNGLRSVTVLQGGKTLAEDLPYDKLDTLPEEVRARVEKMSESTKVIERFGPGKAPRVREPRLKGDGEKIRA